LSNLNEDWNSEAIFQIILQYQIPSKSVYPFARCFMYTDKQMEKF
jgi:hypothetical protein